MDAPALKQISVAPYRLPLVRPFGMPGHAVREREGLIVRLETEDGDVGYGEIAPLPGLHPETLGDARRFLTQIAPTLRDHPVSRMRDALLRTHAPGSVFFGLESAGLAFSISAADRSFAASLAGRPVGPIGVAGLFDADLFERNEAGRESEVARLAPYPAIKVKVGRRAPDVERRMLAQLADALPDASLRLDANQQLDVETARALVSVLDPKRIEYVEEPVPPKELPKFHDTTALPVALDESLRGPALSPQQWRGVTTLIVKPTLFGGIWETAVAWRRQATERGLRLVVSSAVESGVGLSFLAQLAAGVHDDGVAAGIGTDVLLTGDVLDPPFDSSAGFVETLNLDTTPSRRFIESTPWTRL